MKVLVSGSRGLIGSGLARALAEAGHRFARLVRLPRTPLLGDVVWDPDAGTIDTASLAGHDAVVHLAGESLAHRWTRKRRRRIRQSRVAATRLLSEALASLDPPPAVLASASAVGFYGDRGDQPLGEGDPPGEGFLPDLCREWEDATAPAAQAGIRVALLRFGIVLAAHGGAMKRMLLPFRLCLGGRIGAGRQVWSWVALDDAAAAVRHVLEHDALHGPVNVVAPQPVTNAQFTRALGGALHRPTCLPMPGCLASLLFGRMARELLLAGARVEPRKLLASGFAFRHPALKPALRDMLA